MHCPHEPRPDGQQAWSWSIDNFRVRGGQQQRAQTPCCFFNNAAYCFSVMRCRLSVSLCCRRTAFSISVRAFLRLMPLLKLIRPRTLVDFCEAWMSSLRKTLIPIQTLSCFLPIDNFIAIQTFTKRQFRRVPVSQCLRKISA